MLVVSDYLIIGQMLVYFRQGIKIGMKFGQLVPVDSAFALCRRQSGQPFVDCPFHCFRDAFSGPGRKLPDLGLCIGTPNENAIELLVYTYSADNIYCPIRHGNGCPVTFSRSTARQPMSWRQKPSGQRMRSTAA